MLPRSVRLLAILEDLQAVRRCFFFFLIGLADYPSQLTDPNISRPFPQRGEYEY